MRYNYEHKDIRPVIRELSSLTMQERKTRTRKFLGPGLLRIRGSMKQCILKDATPLIACLACTTFDAIMYNMWAVNEKCLMDLKIHDFERQMVYDNASYNNELPPVSWVDTVESAFRLVDRNDSKNIKAFCVLHVSLMLVYNTFQRLEKEQNESIIGRVLYNADKN